MNIARDQSFKRLLTVDTYDIKSQHILYKTLYIIFDYYSLNLESSSQPEWSRLEAEALAEAMSWDHFSLVGWCDSTSLLQQGFQVLANPLYIYFRHDWQCMSMTLRLPKLIKRAKKT